MLRSLALLLFVVSGSALAAAQPPLDLHQPTAQVKAQIDKINADLAGGEVYSEISLDDRSQVREALTRITSRIDRNGEGTLPSQQEATTMNDQELVNTILTKAREDSRLVCIREKTIGSHRVTSNCMTVAQRRRAQADSQERMIKMQRTGHGELL